MCLCLYTYTNTNTNTIRESKTRTSNMPQKCTVLYHNHTIPYDYRRFIYLYLKNKNGLFVVLFYCNYVWTIHIPCILLYDCMGDYDYAPYHTITPTIYILCILLYDCMGDYDYALYHTITPTIYILCILLYDWLYGRLWLCTVSYYYTNHIHIGKWVRYREMSRISGNESDIGKWVRYREMSLFV